MKILRPLKILSEAAANMRIVVIFNPAARGEKSARFRRHLTGLGQACTLRPTTGPGAARTLSAAAVLEGFDTIVAAGGDGTLNEALNGLGDVPDGFARARLGFLPLGTVNVFAREVDLPLQFAAAWKVLCAGREKLIDLPRAEFQNQGQTERRYFIQLAGAGFDARAVETVSWELKKKIGGLAYGVAGFRLLGRPQPLVHASNGTQSASGELVLLGNGRYYGGSYNVFPTASLTSGLLDVSVFPKMGFTALLRAIWGVLSGDVRKACGALPLQGSKIELRSDSPTPFEVDGELAGHLPATITIEPRKLRVIVP